MEIGVKLEDARVQAGMTQEKVAEEVQVTRQTISNWENEKSFPDIVRVIKLSNLYDISLDQLLKGGQRNDRAFRQKYKHCKKQSKTYHSDRLECGTTCPIYIIQWTNHKKSIFNYGKFFSWHYRYLYVVLSDN